MQAVKVNSKSKKAASKTYYVCAAQIRKESVYLRGFGTFAIKYRKENTARNITKNTTLKIPAHDILSFKPAPAFAGSIK